MKEISRRSFLKGLGTSAVAISAIGTGITMGGCAKEDTVSAEQTKAEATATATPVPTEEAKAVDTLAEECAKKACMPCAYPMPGTYDVDYMHIFMSSQTPGSKIYYTMDGSEPTEESEYFDPAHGSISLLGFGNAASQLRSSYVIKAIAAADGLENSDVAVFAYNYENTIAPGQYAAELLRDRTEKEPGLIKLYDYARVNMYLLVGSERALLIDGGMDSSVDLYPVVMGLTGGLPFDLVMPHGHGDHTYQCVNMVKHDVSIYAPEADWFMFEGFGEEVMSKLIDLKEGDRFDLGSTVIEAYPLRGHTPGHMILLDEKMGDLFTSDAIGTSDPWGPNSGLVDHNYPESTMEAYYGALTAAKEWINGRAERIWTGHNTFPITLADTYLDNCIECVKNAVDNGEKALIRSTRPAGSTAKSEAMIGIGDYRTDMDSVAIHVKYLTEKDRVDKRAATGYVGPGQDGANPPEYRGY